MEMTGDDITPADARMYLDRLYAQAAHLYRVYADDLVHGFISELCNPSGLSPYPLESPEDQEIWANTWKAIAHRENPDIDFESDDWIKTARQFCDICDTFAQMIERVD